MPGEAFDLNDLTPLADNGGVATHTPEQALIKIPAAILNNPEAALTREWLVTNGTGGYASSTTIGANTRRYHGLLVASFPPPLERQVVLSKVDEELIIDGEAYPLGTNEYWDGTIHPHGFRLVRSFSLELGIPTFEYRAGGVTLVKQVWMERGKDTVYIRYRLIDGPDDVSLRVRPFCSFRGYHHDGGRDRPEEYIASQHGGRLVVESSHSPYSLKMTASPRGRFEAGADWYHGFLYRAERDRGFDCLEDLYTPGAFNLVLSPGESAGIIASCERHDHDHDLDAAFEREMARRRRLVSKERSAFRKQLLLAADQFVVSPSGNDGGRTGILAGYHWFTDWGRDTMISLPGLLLSTGRFDEAKEILLGYIECADGGMIPNRFTDEGLTEYNTADATLWYFQALHSYDEASGDRELVNQLYHRLAEIVDWHIRGTRYGIHVDPSDGLLRAGLEGSQVTWMDARVDGCPITPRIGKPVEINALWYNALCLMASWSERLDSSPGRYLRAAENCRESFRRRFWLEDRGYLCDVIDGPEGDDCLLRPNQIMAVSLPHSPLDPEQQRSVVEAVESELLTPFGLRSLSPREMGYVGRYQGGPRERDCSYHQGIVWTWLLGQFADAHFRVHGDRKRITDLLTPFRRHLREAGLGSINEIFDGDAPCTPGGCVAQAWSVAEILRIVDLHRQS